jgi:DNA-directed RNA polymerase subunit RPC12/RpoP
VKNSSFLIDYRCPQCGAPAVLTESDRLFACEYCRTRSYLLDRDGFRYRFQPASGPSEDTVYFPYWRFKGMVFSCTPAGIDERFADLSLPAAEARHFPVSLGLRSQALKITHVMPDDTGRFVAPQVPRAEMFRRVESRLYPGRDTALHRAEIGESVSIVYSPFRVGERIVDAILDRPVSTRLPEDPLAGLAPERPETGVRLLSTLCPACGWDLDGASDAQLLACRNCRTAWTPEREGFRRMGVAHQPGASGDAVHLPFWRIQAEADGVPLATYADLVRAANLPRVVQEQWERRPFRYWAPAFKIRPRALLRLLHAVTLGQPAEGELEAAPPRRTAVPVNLPYREALQTLKLNLAGWLKPRERMVSLLPAIRIRPRKILLAYLPFTERHHEYVSERLGIAVRKSHLATASNL